MMTANKILMAAALALGAGLFLAGTEANACGNGKVIFEDKFATFDPDKWGPAHENRFVENGALVLKAPNGFAQAMVGGGDFLGYGEEEDDYYDVAVCVDVTVTNLVDKDLGYTGIVFWHSGPLDYYLYGYWPEAGRFRVDRQSKNKWLYPMPETGTPALKKGVGQTNSLELETKGKKVTLYLNGAKVGEFSGTGWGSGPRIIGMEYEFGGRVGLFTTGSKGETVAKFTNFVIAEPRSGPVSLR